MIFEKKLFSIFVINVLAIILKVNGDDSPSVIIIGAGVSGITVASKLFQNGFQNVKILEAENRIGGRVYTTQFKEYLVDMGAQWVFGEDGNIVLEMVQPLGIVEKSNITNRRASIYDSSGKKMDQDQVNDFYDFFNEIDAKMAEYAKDQTNVAKGEYFTNKLNEYFKAHPNVKENEKGLLQLFNMITITMDAGDSWWEISTTTATEYHDNAGDHLINWKDRGYGTILDILIKRYPNPEEELLVLNNTILNAEVILIDHSDQNGKIVVKTENEEYIADHAIVTCSLGVLKDKHQSLFKPALSEEKQKTIQALGFGVLDKIYLYFNEPWWSEEFSTWTHFVWTDKDFEMIENDPKKKWLLGLVGFDLVEHKPKLLEGWISGNYAREMEKLSDNEILNQCTEILQKFLGNSYKITEPTGIIRTTWNSNKNFQGSYTFRSMKTDAENVWATTLAEPIDETKLKILFAGEATNPHRFGTVQGAMETGWREANRLIEFYPNLAKN